MADDTATDIPAPAGVDPSEEPTVIAVVATERPVLPLRLGDDDDTILYARKPKDVRVMGWADLTRAADQYHVLRDIFRDSPASYDHVCARLQDDDDVLEFEHLTPLLDLLEVRTTGRPTQRPPASGRSSTPRKSSSRSKGKRH